MVDLEERFLPGATFLSEAGVNLGKGSPFIVIPVPVSLVSLNQSRRTCFPVAITNPDRDIICQTGWAGLESNY